MLCARSTSCGWSSVAFVFASRESSSVRRVPTTLVGSRKLSISARATPCPASLSADCAIERSLRVRVASSYRAIGAASSETKSRSPSGSSHFCAIASALARKKIGARPSSRFHARSVCPADVTASMELCAACASAPSDASCRQQRIAARAMCGGFDCEAMAFRHCSMRRSDSSRSSGAASRFNGGLASIVVASVTVLCSFMRARELLSTSRLSAFHSAMEQSSIMHADVRRRSACTTSESSVSTSSVSNSSSSCARRSDPDARRCMLTPTHKSATRNFCGKSSGPASKSAPRSFEIFRAADWCAERESAPDASPLSFFWIRSTSCAMFSVSPSTLASELPASLRAGMRPATALSGYDATSGARAPAVCASASDRRMLADALFGALAVLVLFVIALSLRCVCDRCARAQRRALRDDGIRYHALARVQP